MIAQEERWLLKEKYHDVATSRFAADKIRLLRGEPLAYIIGFVPFLNLQIDVSFRTHTPRVETEFWTEKVIEIMKKDEREKVRCLDLFSGSGCIGLAVAKNIRNADVDLADSDQRCILQIKKNIVVHSIEKEKVTVFQSDIFEAVFGRYDYIFANPPYIALNNTGRVQTSVMYHEPHEALFGGFDGLDIIRRFLTEAPPYLAQNGKIFMEFDDTQKESVEELLIKLDYVDISFGKDQYTRWRFVAAGRGTKYNSC